MPKTSALASMIELPCTVSISMNPEMVNISVPKGTTVSPVPWKLHTGASPSCIRSGLASAPAILITPETSEEYPAFPLTDIRSTHFQDDVLVVFIPNPLNQRVLWP